MGVFNDEDLANLDRVIGQAPAAAKPMLGDQTPPPAPAQPPMPAMQQQQAAPAAQQPSEPDFGQQLDAAMAKMPASAQPPQQASAGAPKLGTSTMDAIEETPLSLMERAMLGWVRTPQEQMKYLKSHFDDAAIQPGQDGATVVVKQDGKWFQANPHFEWKWNSGRAVAGGAAGLLTAGPAGAVAGALAGGFSPSVNATNMKRLPGDLSEMTGEYGLRSAAAIEAGAPTAAAVTAGTAPVLGPFAPVAGLVAGGVAAAAGSAAADAADLGSRAALMDPNAPGAKPYKNADEVNKELMASAMFGAESYGAQRVIQFGAKSAANSFAKTIKSFQDTPEGHESVRRMLSFLGAKPEEIEARLMDPQQNATFDAMRAADNKAANPIGSGTLDRAQEAAAENLHDQVTNIVKASQGEFNAIAANPKVKASEFGLSDALSWGKDELAKGELITEKGATNPLRVLTDTDKRAIDTIMNRLPTSEGLSYSEARATLGDVQSLLGQDLGNANVKRILVGVKEQMHQAIAKDLDAAQPGLGQTYGDIINKYADVKGVQEALDAATKGNKRFAVGKQLLKDNPNETKAAMDGLVNVGVDPKTLVRFVQIEGSRNADSWFTNKRFSIAGVPIPKPGARLGAMGITAGSQVRQAIVNTASAASDSDMGQAILPYMHKVVTMMKGMQGAELKNILSNPKALDALTATIGGAAVNEKAHQEELLKQAGVK